jgi:hypothetical protein
MLTEAHYFELPAPTHINCLAKFVHLGILKAIVAATNKIFVLEALETPSGYLRWNGSPLQISKEARGLEGREIISLDAFNSLHQESRPIIVFTLCESNIYNGNVTKENEIKRFFSLNICGSNCAVNESFDVIMDDKQTINLDFVPLRLQHILCESNRQMGIILSGSDHKLHLYLQNEQNLWKEQVMSSYFPELSQEFKFFPLAFDIVKCDEMRISAIACQSGHLKLLIQQQNQTEPKEESITLEAPLISVKLYNANKKKPMNSQSHIGLILQDISTKIEKIFDSSSTESAKRSQTTKEPENLIHLIVGSAFGFVFLFRDILRFGLSQRQILPESETIDAVVAVDAADINNDGYDEIIVGSYGQKLMIYHAQTADQTKSFSSESISDSLPTSLNNTITSCEHYHEKENRVGSYVNDDHPAFSSTVCSHQFAHPLFGFMVDDFCGDGTQSIVVSSMYGVHLMQANVFTLKKKLVERIEIIHKIIELEKSIYVNNK